MGSMLIAFDDVLWLWEESICGWWWFPIEIKTRMVGGTMDLWWPSQMKVVMS